MNKRSKFSNESFKNKVIEMFENGYKSKEISKILNISKTALIKNLDLLGYNFDRSISMQKYTLNRDYFSKIDSDSKAYWLGLIYADGSNKISNNTFVLGLKKSDSYILELLKKDLNYNNKLKIQKDKRKENREDFYRLEIFNKKLCEDLLINGVFQNKTYTLKEPTIDIKFIYHFIRGYFDGDGGIVTSINKTTNHIKDSINFTGTKEVINFIKNQIKKDLDINSSIFERHPDRNNNNYTITINGRLNVIKLCERMYKDKNEYFLIRKFDKFQKIKNRYE